MKLAQQPADSRGGGLICRPQTAQKTIWTMFPATRDLAGFDRIASAGALGMSPPPRAAGRKITCKACVAILGSPPRHGDDASRPLEHQCAGGRPLRAAAPSISLAVASGSRLLDSWLASSSCKCYIAAHAIPVLQETSRIALAAPPALRAARPPTHPTVPALVAVPPPLDTPPFFPVAAGALASQICWHWPCGH